MPSSSSSSLCSSLMNALHVVARTATRQVRFPAFIRGLIESLLFCGVFLAAGYISLGFEIVDMLVPMVLIVFIMMLSMVFSGVYRPEITNSIINLYIHSAYGFVLASVMFVISLHVFAPQFATLRFGFFFLFFSFFVINTMRPIISGAGVMDGGGRRTKSDSLR